LRRKPAKQNDLERERPAWLEGTGSITDGHVIDGAGTGGREKPTTPRATMADL